MDKLIEAIEAKDNPSVVGLDPTEALIPAQVLESLNGQAGEDGDNVAVDRQSIAGEDVSSQASSYPAGQVAAAFYDFNRAVIDAVKDIVPAVKPQIAMYEAYGALGIDAYRLTCEYAHSQGLYVLGDVKRGDIGSTAAAYAKHLTGVGGRNEERNGQPWTEDAITVNPYFGTDGITPFMDAAAGNGKDVFALVRTSNPSSREIQELRLEGGGCLYEHVADLVEDWGRASRGDHGYSRLGAVVGATHPRQGLELRRRMAHTFFLVPGYGVQGGTANDVAGMFDDNRSGAIVNSSRGIIGAWQKSGEYSPDMDAQEAIDLVAKTARAAVIAMRDDLAQALRSR